MTAQLELGLAGGAGGRPGLAWIRRPDFRAAHRANYDLAAAGSPTGISVQWCGHPTALRPYYVRLADGAPLDVFGRGGLSTFRTSAEAKAAAEEAWQSGA